MKNSIYRTTKNHGMEWSTGIYGNSSRDEPLQEAPGRLRLLRLDAEPVHDLHVLVGVGGFVQVEGAGELLHVDDVGQLPLGEAQDAERPAGRRVTAAVERHDLHRDVPLGRQVEQVGDLPAH